MAARKRNLYITLGVSVVMAVLRSLLVSANLEKNSEMSDLYYLPENFAVVAFAVVSFALVALFLVVAIIFGRKSHICFDDSASSPSVGSLDAAFALLAAVAVYFCTFGIGKKPPIGANGMPPRGPMNEKEISVLEIFVIAFAVGSALKFLLIGIKGYRTEQLTPKSIAVFNLFPIFFSAFRLLNDFIASSSTPNASSGKYHIVSLVAVLLFFLTEGKSYVSKTKCMLADFYGYSAIFLLLVYALPNLMLSCFGIFEFDVDAAFSIVDIAFAVYIVTKLCASKEIDIKEAA